MSQQLCFSKQASRNIDRQALDAGGLHRQLSFDETIEAYDQTLQVFIFFSDSTADFADRVCEEIISDAAVRPC